MSQAQQPAMPVIGFLGASTPSSWAAWTAAFLEGLRELGWIDGRTVKIEYRWAEGQSQRYAEIAAEFVRLKVDVIVTVGTAVTAAKQATVTIPIVFALAVEPVASGLLHRSRDQAAMPPVYLHNRSISLANGSKSYVSCCPVFGD